MGKEKIGVLAAVVTVIRVTVTYIQGALTTSCIVVCMLHAPSFNPYDNPMRQQDYYPRSI